jgi:ParB family chromosome partitioning protein
MSAARSLRSLTSLAAQLDASSREARNVVEIPLDAIRANPQQPRTFFDDKRLEELAASIKANGVQQPIGVTEIEPGSYELVWGDRRCRASKHAGLTHVPALIREHLADADKLAFALIENLEREDMTPYDEAAGVAKLVEKTSVQDAAAILHKPKPWISKRVAIAKAPDFVTKFSASGAVGDTEALYELSKLAADDPAQAKRFIKDFEPGGHLRAQLKDARRPDAGDSEEDDEDQDGRRHGRLAADVAAAQLARPGRGGREEDDDEPGVSHAKRSPSSTPIEVKAVLRQAGQLYLSTPDGKLRVTFSATAKKQLLKLLET